MMERLAALAWLLCALSRAGAGEIFFDFTKEAANGLPAGFESALGGSGAPGRWQLVADEVPSAIAPLTAAAPPAQRSVLAQISRDITDERYPMLIYTNEIFGDFTFTTRVKCVSGAVEQMAGIAFRYQDPQNYYYLRASAKGNTFRFFKIVAGQRSAPIGPELPIPAGVWHELQVACKGNQLQCFLNGKQVIPTMTDNSFASGKVGFWTKSDSVSYFTDARIVYTPRESFAKSVLREMKEKYPRVLAMRIYATPPGEKTVSVISSTDPQEIGMPGGATEQSVIRDNAQYFGKLSPGVVVTLPLRDRNGDTVAALRVEMESFVGQTESNAIARALPIAQNIERRLVEAKYLF